MGRPKSERTIARISVSLEDQDYRELRRLAGDLDVSTAWMVRRAVKEFLAAARQADQPAARTAAKR